ncbi:hypothetical protein KAI12_00495 [Candidatus Bathyarchaeota archaeon]|nr:hypothetical protein [Candidatus Bathyarchaeota archaeon]
MTKKFNQLWRNQYFQTTFVIVLIALVVFGFWYGSQLALDTQHPALAVVSGSMCVPQGSRCDGWTTPFSTTLHVGDMIIVQGVDPMDLSDDYPHSDVIVFRKPTDDEELIVHRIVVRELDLGGSGLTFRTKGDGNGVNKWPSVPNESEYDPWPVSENDIVGKVVLRIPWIGHIVLLMHNSVGVPLIIVLTVLLLVVEFVVPILGSKRAKTNARVESENPL